MISCNLFSDKEEKMLQLAFLNTLSTIHVFELVYNNDFKVCAYIRMLLDESNVIIVTTGKFADNITIFDELDFLNDMERYHLQENVKINEVALHDSDEIIGKRLTSIECVEKLNEEYYASLNFHFENKVLNIHALVDELEFSIDNIPGLVS